MGGLLPDYMRYVVFIGYSLKFKEKINLFERSYRTKVAESVHNQHYDASSGCFAKSL